MDKPKSDIQMDKWEEALEIEIEKLNNCQFQRGIESCLRCSLILDCLLRKEYIKAVYESMNKGTGGGFEF